MVTDEAEVSEAIHAAAHPGRTRHDVVDGTAVPEAEKAGEGA
jgi:hypothetical protein